MKSIDKILHVMSRKMRYMDRDINTFDYIVNEEGGRKGYTMYGDWYGIPYGDWNAMFVSFCLSYAGIPVHYMPQESVCGRWVDVLDQMEMYADVSSGYEPKPGDLVFFCRDDSGEARHVGIVNGVFEAWDADIEEYVQKLETIEGSSSGCVQYVTYDRYDPSILGFGMLPVNPDLKVEFDGGTEDVDVHVSARRAAFPNGAYMEVTPVSRDDVYDVVNETVSGDVQDMLAVDITFYDADGNEIEPAEPISVVMTPVSAPVDTAPVVVHVDDEGEANLVYAEQDGDDTAFEADAFSVYVLTYTVDFHYEVDGELYEYSIPGGGVETVSHMLETLGIVYKPCQIL